MISFCYLYKITNYCRESNKVLMAQMESTLIVKCNKHVFTSYLPLQFKESICLEIFHKPKPKCTVKILYLYRVVLKVLSLYWYREIQILAHHLFLTLPRVNNRFLRKQSLDQMKAQN